MLTHADGNILGIPHADFPIFKQYVRDHCRVDLNAIPEALKYTKLERLANEWLDERSKRMNAIEKAKLDKLREAAAVDRLELAENAKKGTRDYTPDELMPDPAHVGAVPLESHAELPPRKRKAR
jgi:hypothetical protein